MNNNLTTIYLVRHGESAANACGDGINHKFGEFGSPLTEKGIKQAQERKETLKHVNFDAAFSSDLVRAKQTAEIIVEEKNIAIKTTNIIRERESHTYLKNYPSKTREQFFIELQEALKDLDEKAKMQYKHGPDMESAEESVVRLITYLREIAVAYQGKTVLVVNHGNIMRSLLTHLGWAKYDELPSKTVENTGYIVLESDGVDFFIKEVHGVRKQIGKVRDW